MARGEIYLESDWTEIEEELDRVIEMPTPEMVGLLELAGEEDFVQIEAQEHVETGSMKGSTKHTTTVNKIDKSVENEVSVGGVSTGVNNPVDYAIYEQRRGGSHDFIKPAEKVADKRYGGAMVKGLGGKA